MENIIVLAEWQIEADLNQTGLSDPVLEHEWRHILFSARHGPTLNVHLRLKIVRFSYVRGFL